MKDFCVLLDNGHGKDTPGKRSPVWEDGTPQILEWEYTRKVTAEIEKRLKKLGVKCVRLVTEEKDVTLSNRASRANKIAKTEHCVMVSVHCNAAKEPNTATGWEVWSTTAKNNSDKLAQCFIEAFGKCLPGKKLRGHREKNYTVLYKTDCPCVLTENFFMDNIEDCKFMLSDDGFDKIVQLHVEAVLAYQKKYWPETVKDTASAAAETVDKVTSRGCHMK